MLFPPKTHLDSAALALALLLGIYSLWVLSAEFVRSGLALEPTFPTSISPQDINSKRLAANIAASIGLIRGDLWSERALVDAASVIEDPGTPTTVLTAEAAASERAAAERALSWKPIDSRVWLVLAAISSDRAGQHERANQQLKMSYYTGPNDKAIIGHRLKLVMISRALDDIDLRELVRREIRTILLRAPTIRPAIVAAYRKAQPPDREFIEKTVAAIDPGFVATLRAGQSD
jgi:hypothetical protein